MAIEVVSRLSNYDNPRLGRLIKFLTKEKYVALLHDDVISLKFNNTDDPEDEVVLDTLAEDLPEFVVDEILSDPDDHWQSGND